MQLKYLFTAVYEDGSTYQQTAEDKSLTEPETRSQFYDVLQIAEKKKLVAFVLKGADHAYGVDLRDGHFEINGLPFDFHEEANGKPVLPIGVESTKNLTLIFWRRHKVHIAQGRFTDKEIGHEVTYDLGWKTEIGGKHYQRIIHIN